MAKNNLNDDSIWLSPKEAVGIARVSHGDEASRIILERLKANFLTAMASRWSDAMEGGLPTVSEKPDSIPASYWSAMQSEHIFWTAGDAHFVVDGGIYGSRTVRCTGIRFLRKTIEEMFPAPPPTLTPPTPSPPSQIAAPPPPSATAPNKGGRPPKEFWEDLWVEMCRQIWAGDLKLDKQADVEKAMLDWASANGHQLGEQSARTRARKLMAAARKEDKN